MGDLESHSTSEESTEQDPKGKGKVSSHFKIKIKNVQAEEVQEAAKQRKPIAKKRGHASRNKKPKKDEVEKEDKEVSASVPKRRRIVRMPQKEKGSSKVGEEVGPPIINVESLGERTQVYTRKSRTPSPKDSVPQKDVPPVTPVAEQHDNVPPPHEASNVLGEPKEAKTHQDPKGEEFQEGELYSAKAEIERVLQSPLVTYDDSRIDV